MKSGGSTVLIGRWELLLRGMSAGPPFPKALKAVYCTVLLSGIIFTASVLCTYAQDPQDRPDLTFVTPRAGLVKTWLGEATVDVRPKAGRKSLILKLINMDDAEHGFAIDPFNVREVLKPGESKTVSVPVDQIDAGIAKVRYYCYLHADHVPGTMLLIR